MEEREICRISSGAQPASILRIRVRSEETWFGGMDGTR